MLIWRKEDNVWKPYEILSSIAKFKTMDLFDSTRSFHDISEITDFYRSLIDIETDEYKKEILLFEIELLSDKSPVTLQKLLFQDEINVWFNQYQQLYKYLLDNQKYHLIHHLGRDYLKEMNHEIYSGYIYDDNNHYLMFDNSSKMIVVSHYRNYDPYITDFDKCIKILDEYIQNINDVAKLNIKYQTLFWSIFIKNHPHLINVFKRFMIDNHKANSLEFDNLYAMFGIDNIVNFIFMDRELDFKLDNTLDIK